MRVRSAPNFSGLSPLGSGFVSLCSSPYINIATPLINLKNPFFQLWLKEIHLKTIVGGKYKVFFKIKDGKTHGWEYATLLAQFLSFWTIARLLSSIKIIWLYSHSSKTKDLNFAIALAIAPLGMIQIRMGWERLNCTLRWAWKCPWNSAELGYWS